jgi:acyl-CoA thioesterase FadM
MFVNRIRIRVEFGDSDPANIAFFANYFRWSDQCTSALFRVVDFRSVSFSNRMA